jgi:peptidyl-prolyl cis-trans isomerase C
LVRKHFPVTLCLAVLRAAEYDVSLFMSLFPLDIRLSLRFRTGLFVICLLLPLAAACQPKRLQPVAEVNGDVIRREDFESELRRVRGDTGDRVQGEVLKVLKSSILNQMIERRLVLATAEEFELKVTDQEIDDRIALIRGDYPEGGFEKAIRENFVSLMELRTRLSEAILHEKIVEEAVGKHLDPDEEEFLRYYQTNASAFSLADRVQVRQIVIRTRDEAEALRMRILRGESFEELARAHSLSPDKESGGDIGVFGRGEMPPEFDVAFSLSVGKVSEVVQSDYGYHLMMVVDKLPARLRPFSEVREQVRERMLVERRESAYQNWIQQLRDQAEIHIREDVVADVN